MALRFCRRCGRVFECMTYAGEQRICGSCDMRPAWLKGKSTLPVQIAKMRFPKLFKGEKIYLIRSNKHGSNRRYD